MKFNDFFTEELVYLDLQFDNNESLLSHFSKEFSDKGLVKPSFESNIISREAEYPTGIQTETIGVAIPHTDPENIIEPFVAVIRPTSPVKFEPMGMADGTVEASLIFILGVKNDGGQVQMLQGIMNLLMNNDAVNSILEEKDKSKIIDIIVKNIGG